MEILKKRAVDLGVNIVERVMLTDLLTSDGRHPTAGSVIGAVGFDTRTGDFVVATSKWQVVALFLLFGLFYTIDEAQSKAFISDLEVDRRATAIGMSNFVNGLIYLPASAIAGMLWTINPAFAFVFAAVVALVALLVFIFLQPRMMIGMGVKS